MFRVVPTLGEPWELISQIQTTQPGRVVIGVSCLVFFQGHPSKYYEPFSALLNFKWKPELQPPHHLSTLGDVTRGPFSPKAKYKITLLFVGWFGQNSKQRNNNRPLWGTRPMTLTEKGKQYGKRFHIMVPPDQNLHDDDLIMWCTQLYLKSSGFRNTQHVKKTLQGIYLMINKRLANV